MIALYLRESCAKKRLMSGSVGAPFQDVAVFAVQTPFPVAELIRRDS